MYWLIKNQENNYVICNARNREYAKAKATQYLAGNPDNFIVTPLTEGPCKVYFDISTEHA